jgi:hydrogenase small subunit
MEITLLQEADESAEAVSRRLQIGRREFLQFCAAAAGTLGLPAGAEAAIAKAVEQAQRPSVIWLHFQECTGCTESLLRAEHPTLEKLILDVISLDYHETLMAAAGHQAEAARKAAMAANKGKYVLVVEGAVPTKENGIHCKVGGKTAIDLLKECAADAAAVIAIGSCAAWGGMPSTIPSLPGADSSPTGASGIGEVLGKPVVTIPGCPPSPYNFLVSVVHLLTFGKLPETDKLGRPLFAYGRLIHEHCERRAHFDAGRFAIEFGDEGHRQGWCLYKLGCKGPMTYANCPTIGFGDVGESSWPVACGHPCIGCTEKGVGFQMPIHQTAKVLSVAPPLFYPGIHERQGKGVSAAAAAALAVLAGAAAGGTAMLARNLGRAHQAEQAEKPTESARGANTEARS